MEPESRTRGPAHLQAGGDEDQKHLQFREVNKVAVEEPKRAPSPARPLVAPLSPLPAPCCCFPAPTSTSSGRLIVATQRRDAHARLVFVPSVAPSPPWPPPSQPPLLVRSSARNPVRDCRGHSAGRMHLAPFLSKKRQSAVPLAGGACPALGCCWRPLSAQAQFVRRALWWADPAG